MLELVERRTENSKTFDLGGGQRRLEAGIGARHYKDDYSNASESWKDIDLTWVNNQILTAPYELTRSGQQYTFKNKKTGEVSTIERISVSPAGIPFEIIPELSAVRFRHTLPSSNIPFEAQFRITGKAPITRAFDDEGELELETIFVGDILTEKLSQIRDKRTGQDRPAKGNIRIDPTWQVGASSDDTYRRLNTSLWDLTSLVVPAGSWNSGLNSYGGGMRFTNITIAQGSIIDTAKLTLKANQDFSGTIVNTRISAEDVDDAPTFANDAAAFDTRWAARTTARVDWDNIAAWTAEIDYDSPEIKTVIQEIVDRVGWASGNDMVIFWDDFDNRSTQNASALRYARSYDHTPAHAPKLVITYTTITAPTVTVSAATSITDTTATLNGNVTATGGENPTVTVYWGTTDGGQTPGNWANSSAPTSPAQPQGVAAFTKNVTGVTTNILYYFSAKATNSAGTDWPPASLSFTTLLTPKGLLVILEFQLP